MVSTAIDNDLELGAAAVTVPELDGGRCRHERSHDGACLDCGCTFETLFDAMFERPDPDVYDEDAAQDRTVGA